MKYCNYCKQEIEDNINICPNCKHHLDTNDALIIFLKKHTKDKFLNSVEDNLFNYLKNFILSHLYGFILTMTVIMIPVSYITNTTDVKTVNNRPVINNTQQEVITDNNKEEIKTLSEEDKQQIINVINTYATSLEASNGQITADLTNIWLSDSIISNTLHHALNDRFNNDIYPSDYVVNSELKYDMNYDYNQPFTTTGETLKNMGYKLIVIKIINTLYFENHPDYEKAYPNYYCTMVKINNTWYIAEEINTTSRWSECKDLWTLN